MLATVVFVGIFLYFLYYHFVQKRQHLPPGPIPLPIIGNIFQIDQKAPHKTIVKWSKKYGPILTVWLGPEANVFVTDYSLLKEYIIKQGDVYAGRSRNFVFDYFVGGNYGIVLSDGPLWKEQRRFSLHVLRDFGFGRNIMEAKINTQSDRLIKQINEMLGKSHRKVLSLKHPLELCVGNIINSIVFGHAYEKDDTQFVKIKALLDENIRLLNRPEVLLLSAYPWLRHAPLFGNFGYKLMTEHRDGFYEFFDEEIEEHQKNFDETAESNDFTTAYQKEMLRRKKAGEDMGHFSEWQLKMTISDIWGAGLETTVTTLKWGVLFMVHHPDVEEKCAREIQAFLAEKDSEVIEMADRSRLPYTAATVNEIQRSANLIPINIQHAVTQDTVLNGYRLEKGTIVVPQISAVLHDSKIFPNPDKFMPERFLEEDGTLKKVEELIPFSIGKRMCMGESLARMELFLIFSALVRNFRFLGIPGNPLPTLESRPGFTRAPYEYEVTVQKREYIEF